MSKCLENKKQNNFLKFIGYPREYNLEGYINELVNRLHSDQFPHEIGIFLGYPIKDVLGFMGYGKQELSCIYGWRVYGNKEISYQTYSKFVEDKQKMQIIVDNLSIKELKSVI